MKKILWLTFIFTLLFVSHSFAAYGFTAKPSGTTISASLTGGVNGHLYKLVAQTDNFSSDTYTGTKPTELSLTTDASVKKAVITAPSTTGTVSWTIEGNKPSTLYYLRVLDVPPTGTPVFITPTSSVTTSAVLIPTVALTSSKDGDDVIVKGQISATQIPGFKPESYKAVLYYTKTVPQQGAKVLPDEGTGPITSKKTDRADGDDGINADGTYYWRLTSLSPSTTYYIQQTIYLNGGAGKTDTIANFNSSTGNIIATVADQTTYNDEHSYTLLSGFPSFTVLPDPDLCAQQRASGLNPQFCDMNDVINYFLKLLIGLSAVFLVFRLMYEGYIILVSDTPFRVASAKGKFFSVLGGLLLALSSYIILNTINPKLVSNTVGVTQLSIGIDGDANIPTVFVNSGAMPKAVYCPGSGKSSAVAKIAQSYIGKVTYSQTNKSATAQADGYARLDCSSFVNTVLNCAGYKAGTDFVNEGTSSIFNGSEKLTMASDFVINGNTVSVKGKALNPGDLVGWPPAGGAGHVLIYVGNGTFMDSHGGTAGRQPGNAIGTYTATQIKSLYGGNTPSKTINSIRRIPSL